MYRSIILKISDYKKIVIFALNGCIVTPFFGASLAADFRFASEESGYCLAHFKYGLHPSGGLPFFLPRFVGQSKATEILFGGKNITAKDAFKLNIINKIFPVEDFENKCLEEATVLSKIDNSVVRLTKRLISSYHEELEKYFNIEGKMIGF